IAIAISTVISIVAAASSAIAAVVTTKVHLLYAVARKQLRSSQDASFINAFLDLVEMPKPLRARESSSFVNSPPQMTRVADVTRKHRWISANNEVTYFGSSFEFCIETVNSNSKIEESTY
ncbi:hypothetical protein HN51_016172, partial [Arachis hypogaea]